MKLLSESEILSGLGEIPGWLYSDKKIFREFKLADFSASLAFIIRVGIEAEKADHHPDIRLHSYNKVIIELATHSAGGVTINDISLAKQIEKIQ